MDVSGCLPGMTALAVIALLVCGCMSAPPQNGTVTITSRVTMYTPVMSSTVGVDLTPHYSAPSADYLRYHWVADYGTFVSWNAPDFRVSGLGDDAVCGNGTVYWTYLPDLPGEEPETVTITLFVEDARSGTVLARAEKQLAWDDSGGYYLTL